MGGSGIFALDSLLTPPCGIQQLTSTFLESNLPLDTLTWYNYTPSTYLAVDTLPIIQLNSLPVANDLCLVLSSHETVPKDLIQITPNPAHEFFQINSTSSSAQLEILNAIGKFC